MCCGQFPCAHGRLNTSRAAEAGIEAAVKEAKGKAWLEENRGAIQAYNERIDRQGTLIKPTWNRFMDSGSLIKRRQEVEG